MRLGKRGVLVGLLTALSTSVYAQGPIGANFDAVWNLLAQLNPVALYTRPGLTQVIDFAILFLLFYNIAKIAWAQINPESNALPAAIALALAGGGTTFVHTIAKFPTTATGTQVAQKGLFILLGPYVMFVLMAMLAIGLYYFARIVTGVNKVFGSIGLVALTLYTIQITTPGLIQSIIPKEILEPLNAILLLVILVFGGLLAYWIISGITSGGASKHAGNMASGAANWFNAKAEAKRSETGQENTQMRKQLKEHARADKEAAKETEKLIKELTKAEEFTLDLEEKEAKSAREQYADIQKTLAVLGDIAYALRQERQVDVNGNPVTLNKVDVRGVVKSIDVLSKDTKDFEKNLEKLRAKINTKKVAVNHLVERIENILREAQALATTPSIVAIVGNAKAEDLAELVPAYKAFETHFLEIETAMNQMLTKVVQDEDAFKAKVMEALGHIRSMHAQANLESVKGAMDAFSGDGGALAIKEMQIHDMEIAHQQNEAAIKAITELKKVNEKITHIFTELEEVARSSA